MSEGGSQRTFAIQEFRGILIAPIQVELTSEIQTSLRDALLEAIRRTGASGVILNISGLDVMDVREFESLRRTLHMAEIMGARCIVTGAQPGVVAALIDLDADVDGLETALTVEHAMALLEPSPEQAPDDEEGAEDDDERSTADGVPDDAGTDDRTAGNG